MPENVLITVSNLTPLTVTVNQIPGNGPKTLVTTLSPFDSQDHEAVVGSSWEINDKYSGQLVAKLALTDQTTEWTITEKDIHSQGGGEKRYEEFHNATSYAVELSWINFNGQDVPQSTIQPGQNVGEGTYPGHAFRARSTATKESVALFIMGAEPNQRFEITDDFRKLKASRGAKPQGDGSLQNPFLIDAVRDTLKPEDRSYIHISTHTNLREVQFNTLENRATQTVKISGVKLIWDRQEDHYGLMAYQGDNVLDLKALEMSADQVIIRSPLRFPRTAVTIYARELIFEKEGAIDTTPSAYLKPARTPGDRTKDDYLIGPDSKPLYATANGTDGEQAGDINLYVRQIVDGSPEKKRFICQGSRGQEAEKGGVKLYEPNSPDQPSADAGRDLKPVAVKDIRDHLNEQEPIEEKRENYWRWPDGNGGFGVWNLESISMKDDALKKGNIVHLKLIFHNGNAYICRARRTFFPGRDSIRTLGCELLPPVGFIPNPARVACVEGEVSRYRGMTDSNRKKPGDGPDAYASGKPGDGGKGRQIISHLGSAPLDARSCDVSGGKPGPDSPTISGGEPGKPVPAYWADMYVIQSDAIQATANPSISLTEVTAKKGQDAGGKSGKEGDPGKVESQPGTGLLWLHPEALGAVVAYATDAYRNGHRDDARRILDPYYRALFVNRATLSATLLGQLSRIESMRTNMNNNLDYYGNPPGWLPRLDVKTNYQVWHLFSEEASKILYFAQKTEREWDRFEDEQEALSQTSEALSKELDVTAAELRTSYDNLKDAREKVEDIRKQFEAKSRDVDALRQLATTRAKDKIAEQRVFSGIMKLVGGLAESIPIGQPYLGGAGKTLSLAGDIDWTKPDSSKEIGKFFTKLGEQTDAFLVKHEDLIVKKSGAGVLKPEGSTIDLETQITQAKGAVEALDKEVVKHAKAVDTEWSDVMTAERDRIKQQIADANATIKDLIDKGKPNEADAKKTEVTDLTRFQQELAEATKLKLTNTKAKLYAELAQLNQDVKKQADTRTKLKNDLLKKAEALEAKKADFEGQVKTYEKDKETREEKTKGLLSSLSGLGSGITQIGQGIVALSAPYDETEVDRLAEGILAGAEFRDDYLKLLREVKELNAQKASAVATFCLYQQMINTHSARISSAVLEMTAISNQRQVVDAVLDPDMKQYLRSMQNRAKESLLWSQYHFIKAAQYEYLLDVGDDFANLEQWVDKLRTFELKKAGIGEKAVTDLTEDDRRKAANTFLGDADFQAIGKTVRNDHLLDLIKKIVAERQHYANLTKNSYDCALSEKQLVELAKEGKLTFNLITDFEKGSSKAVQAKISDINLEVFKIDATDASLSIDVDFVHSGTSVLLGSNNQKYYSFQKAPNDNPIVWGFIYNHQDYLRLKAEKKEEEEIWNYTGTRPIRKDAEMSAPDSTFLKSEFDQELEYKEYLPSFFSNITLWLNRGSREQNQAKYQAFLAKITKIEKVEFSVEIVKQGTA